MKMSITYEQCKNGHEAVEHMTRKHCPLCQISGLKEDVDEMQKANERITEALNECQNANGSLAFAHARLMDENTKLKTALENIIKHQGIITGNSQIMKTTVQRIAEEALSKN